MNHKREITKGHFILISLISAFCTVWMYSAIHILGHSIVGWLYGGTVQGISVLSGAHVDIYGMHYSRFGLALFDIFGHFLPMLIGLSAMFSYKRKDPKSIKSIVVAHFNVVVMLSYAPWVVLAIIYMTGTPPNSYDAIKFLDHTHLPPMMLALFSILLMGAMAYMIFEVCKMGASFWYSKEEEMKLLKPKEYTFEDLLKNTQPEEEKKTAFIEKEEYKDTVSLDFDVDEEEFA